MYSALVVFTSTKIKRDKAESKGHIHVSGNLLKFEVHKFIIGQV